MSSRNSTRREQAADRIHSAAIHLLRRLRTSDNELGLSASRLSVLSVLVFSGDKTLGELARAEQVKPPTMTKLIQALESDGLVERSPVAQDKRSICVKATAKGRRLLRKGRQLRVQGLAELMESLSEDEIATLSEASHLLERILQTEIRD